MSCRYMASAQLESFILNQAPPHHPTSNAPSSYEELRAWHDRTHGVQSMPVFDGGCDNTIYSHARYNYAFRAWHDQIHIDLGLTFSKLDEIRTCNEHIRQMTAHRAMFNLTTEDVRAIRYDVAGQIMYYYTHKKYVKDQARFVQACFDARSMFHVIQSGVEY